MFDVCHAGHWHSLPVGCPGPQFCSVFPPTFDWYVNTVIHYIYTFPSYIYIHTHHRSQDYKKRERRVFQMSRKHTHTADVRSPRRQITNAVHNEWCQPFAYTGCSIKAIYCVNTFAIQLKPVVERIFQHIVLPYCRARSPAAISCVHEEEEKKSWTCI